MKIAITHLNYESAFRRAGNILEELGYSIDSSCFDRMQMNGQKTEDGIRLIQLHFKNDQDGLKLSVFASVIDESYAIFCNDEFHQQRFADTFFALSASLECPQFKLTAEDYVHAMAI